MLGCVPMDVASLCGTALEGVGSGWLSPVLGLISHLVQWALWSGLIRRLVCEQLLVPSTCPFSGGVGSRPAECISCVCIIQVWYFAEFQFVLQSSAFSRKIKEDREKKKKKEKWPVTFPKTDWQLCQSHPTSGLPQLLCAIKHYFKDQSLNFMCTLCVGGNLIG
jgi:hypothetical protein